MTGTWRDWRPAIWATFLGVAVALLVSPWVFSGLFFGAAIFLAARVPLMRRRASADQQRDGGGRQRPGDGRQSAAGSRRRAARGQRRR
jgi:hypothetical protein